MIVLASLIRQHNLAKDPNLKDVDMSRVYAYTIEHL